ncbi:MAG TPA: N-acetylmuramoyl-L-alanine amidase [Nitrospirae bacterium]|nr:N-acetylmuramoyl-L-alanine amidase [Nitrospirota bacterium]
MKKTVLLLIFLLFLPSVTNSGIYFLKLRTSQHPGFLRIVLEGHESIISKGHVYQRGRNIVVAFPDTGFSIQTEKFALAYRKEDRETIIFSPGDFRGLKVFTLKHPDRLVIDVYMKEKGKGALPFLTPTEKERQNDLPAIETVVIDPGHGGYENGLVKNGYKEKNAVLDIAKKLGALINNDRSRSFLTRGSDRFMTLSERVKYANSKEPDVFISLHVGNHSGITIYVPVITEYVSDIVRPHLANRGQADYMEKTAALLQAMKEAVISGFGDDMVSIRPLPYSILSKIEAAALIIELPSFEDAYYIEELKAEIADTLYKGLYIYEEIKAN